MLLESFEFILFYLLGFLDWSVRWFLLFTNRLFVYLGLILTFLFSDELIIVFILNFLTGVSSTHSYTSLVLRGGTDHLTLHHVCDTFRQTV